MSLLEGMGRLAQSMLTMDSQMKEQRADVDKVVERLQSLSDNLHVLDKRVVRLETQRETDRDQLAAQIAIFKSEVERTAPRRSRSLPESED